jgi:hypothetical protein
MAAGVRPGGWLVVEEGDCGCFGAADPCHPRAAGYDRLARAVLDALQARGVMDCSFGRRLHGLVGELGFADVGHEGVAPVSRGGGRSARFYRMSNQVVRGPLVAAGALTQEEFEELQEAYWDPSFAFVGLALFGAWGRRPAGPGRSTRPQTGRTTSTLPE